MSDRYDLFAGISPPATPPRSAPARCSCISPTSTSKNSPLNRSLPREPHTLDSQREQRQPLQIGINHHNETVNLKPFQQKVQDPSRENRPVDSSKVVAIESAVTRDIEPGRGVANDSEAKRELESGQAVANVSEAEPDIQTRISVPDDWDATQNYNASLSIAKASECMPNAMNDDTTSGGVRNVELSQSGKLLENMTVQKKENLSHNVAQLASKATTEKRRVKLTGRREENYTSGTLSNLTVDVESKQNYEVNPHQYGRSSHLLFTESTPGSNSDAKFEHGCQLASVSNRQRNAKPKSAAISQNEIEVSVSKASRYSREQGPACPHTSKLLESAEPFWLRSASAILTSDSERDSHHSSDVTVDIETSLLSIDNVGEAYLQLKEETYLDPLLEDLLAVFRDCDAEVSRSEDQAAREIIECMTSG